MTDFLDLMRDIGLIYENKQPDKEDDKNSDFERAV